MATSLLTQNPIALALPTKTSTISFNSSVNFITLRNSLEILKCLKITNLNSNRRIWLTFATILITFAIIKIEFKLLTPNSTIPLMNLLDLCHIIYENLHITTTLIYHNMN
uniref:Uncharacterized protein n=1 Tax=Physcomitrium patens TaxID=3218 RepID=A0A2K1KE40_PHYPA|nr:hypothetical protein PHYPA_008418 [Physcomitrium patens]